MTASRSHNMGLICFRHIVSVGLGVYMAVFEVLFVEHLYFIDHFSGIFWKLFWNLHRLSVYLESERNPALSGIGITCPACYMLPICSF